ncbi:MAG: (d)CMP kinase [Acidobacteria bacterium]|nr:MAG: (d)CMP kinase [Acidobacteriota bacterium]REK10433.1 MAG: (d)CMP kinase [Acidobacteriota bacterium]
MVVAIDGPAGVGKSSVARRLAKRLGLPFVDTGAMYRCVAWACLRDGVDRDDEARVGEVARRLPLRLAVSSAGETRLELAGRPVGDEIRTEEVSMATSEVARLPAVRTHLLELQRDFGRRHGGVLEGRDIGTVVFPDTPYKFFLDADVGVRAERRARQQRASGADVDTDRLRRELQRRDSQDSQRETAPLRRDPSYEVVDTGDLDEDEVVERLVQLVRVISRRTAGPSASGAPTAVGPATSED